MCWLRRGADSPPFFAFMNAVKTLLLEDRAHVLVNFGAHPLCQVHSVCSLGSGWWGWGEGGRGIGLVTMTQIFG